MSSVRHDSPNFTAIKALIKQRQYHEAAATISSHLRKPEINAGDISRQLIYRMREQMVNIEHEKTVYSMSGLRRLNSMNIDLFKLRALCYHLLNEKTLAFEDERAVFYLTKEFTVPPLKDLAKFAIFHFVKSGDIEMETPRTPPREPAEPAMSSEFATMMQNNLSPETLSSPVKPRSRHLNAAASGGAKRKLTFDTPEDDQANNLANEKKPRLD